MCRFRAKAVICGWWFNARSRIVMLITGVAFFAIASGAQINADESNTSIKERPKCSDVELVDELLASDERNSARIASELQRPGPNASLIADKVSKHVEDCRLEPHVRFALLQVLVANDLSTNRSFNALAAIATDQCSLDGIRIYALDVLPTVGRRSRALSNVVDASIHIAEDRGESALLRLSALYTAMTANGAAEVELRISTEALKDSAEDVEFRAGVVKFMSVLSLYAPEESEAIAIALLDAGRDPGVPRAIRLDALSSCFSVILKAELFDVQFDRARTAIDKVGRAILLDEREGLPMRVAAGELLCALRQLDAVAVDDLMKALRSRHSELQEIAARAIGKIGPNAMKARSCLVELRARNDISVSVRKAVNEALSSLEMRE